MNKDILKGKWNQVKGSIRSKWGELTNDDLDIIQGDGEKFLGILQEKYGYGRDKAEREVNEFLSGLSQTDTSASESDQSRDKKRRVS